MMAGHIRKAAIRKIASDRGVSYTVASHIYACASIKQKQAWCRCIERHQRTVDDESFADRAIQVSIDMACGIPTDDEWLVS